MIKINPILSADGYKTSHHLMYAPGTTMVYSNFTPRNVKYMPEKAKDIVNVGVELVFQYLHEFWQENFFSKDKNEVCQDAKKKLSKYLMCDYDVTHFEELHDLGYLPIEVKSLEEGTVLKTANIPLFTIKNTNPKFFWITNFLETNISNLIWKPVHSASLAYGYKKILTKYAKETDFNNLWLVNFQAHDFSLRGMQSPESGLHSGIGFAAVFGGSDTIQVLEGIPYYYGDSAEVYSVNATEHSVMCSGSKEGEIETFKRLLNTFPKGILSVVSDTWDLWKVVTEYLPQLKEQILARDGKLVIRPDSGDPVDIICGTMLSSDPDFLARKNSSEEIGVIELLWNIFGGTINEQGYKVLDSHIGAIYGDSITIERCEQICERLKAKGFASTNIVLGVGSFSMGYATRDNQCGAVKSTAIVNNGELVEIFKDPVTDDGTKKSAKGLLSVVLDDSTEKDELKLHDQCTWEEEQQGLLLPLYKDGKFLRRTKFNQIKERINYTL